MRERPSPAVRGTRTAFLVHSFFAGEKVDRAARQWGEPMATPVSTEIVAVVDGRRSVHDFVYQTLADAGYAVRGYDARATFLVEVASVRPRIVLLGADDDAFDVDTPLVVRTLRDPSLAVRLPIILYSANPHAHEREQAERMDDTITLPAPFSAAQLLTAVREVIEKSLTAQSMRAISHR